MSRALPALMLLVAASSSWAQQPTPRPFLDPVDLSRLPPADVERIGDRIRKRLEELAPGTTERIGPRLLGQAPVTLLCLLDGSIANRPVVTQEARDLHDLATQATIAEIALGVGADARDVAALDSTAIGSVNSLIDVAKDIVKAKKGSDVAAKVGSALEKLRDAYSLLSTPKRELIRRLEAGGKLGDTGVVYSQRAAAVQVALDAAVTAAEALGWIKPKHAERAKKFLAVAGVAAQVAIAVFTSGASVPIQALIAKAGLALVGGGLLQGILGGGGGAGGSAQVLAKLDQMDKKLDLILENQRRILAAIEALRADIKQLSKEIHERFDSVDAALRALNQNVQFLAWHVVMGRLDGARLGLRNQAGWAVAGPQLDALPQDINVFFAAIRQPGGLKAALGVAPDSPADKEWVAELKVLDNPPRLTEAQVALVRSELSRASAFDWSRKQDAVFEADLASCVALPLLDPAQVHYATLMLLELAHAMTSVTNDDAQGVVALGTWAQLPVAQQRILSARIVLAHDLSKYATWLATMCAAQQRIADGVLSMPRANLLRAGLKAAPTSPRALDAVFVRDLRDVITTPEDRKVFDFLRTRDDKELLDIWLEEAKLARDLPWQFEKGAWALRVGNTVVPSPAGDRLADPAWTIRSTIEQRRLCVIAQVNFELQAEASEPLVLQ